MTHISNGGVSMWRSLLGYLKHFSTKNFQEWQHVFFKGGNVRGKGISFHPESNVLTGSARQISCIPQCQGKTLWMLEH